MGMLPHWHNDDDRWLVLEALERDAHAASTRESMEAKLRTVHRALAGWGLVPFPPSLWTVRALGATLKRGGYRSAASYLWLYKAEAQRRGHSWPDYLHRALKDSIRSCERGMAPHSRASSPLCPAWHAASRTGALGSWRPALPAKSSRHRRMVDDARGGAFSGSSRACGPLGRMGA